MSIAPFALLLAAFAPSVWATQTNPATWTLARVLNQVAQRSPAVLAAHAGIDEAKSHVGQARAHWFGTVDLYTISNHYNVPMLIQPITAFPPPKTFGKQFANDQLAYGIEAKLPLDFSLRIAAEVDAASAAERASRWNARNVELQTLLTASAVYRNIQALHGKRSALEEELKALRKAEATARSSFKAGLSTRLKLLRVQSGVENVRAGLAGVDGQIASLKADLASLMGLNHWAGNVTPLTTPPAHIPAAVGVAPFVQAAEQADAATGYKVSAAKRALLPQFFIGARWNENGRNGFKDDFFTRDIQLGFKWNLWSGFGQVSSIDAAQAAHIQASEKARGAQLKLAAIRASARARWHAQALAWEANRAGVAAAREAADSAQGQFKAGLLAATSLLQAEAALSGSRAAETATLARWWEANDALRYAEGLPPMTLSAPSN
ncbi:TolC family protein [Acidihalobacter ferrooxydans]|uniref:Transporter n=1 Tax=Acidihalobacter ferrooxydans TaxID=1765967 RepID=A0A1P8UJM9_9GAMM|nr:TolC family protein [Acidihalobacter ferrooxydans]APZ43994.1 hypothetical protein BW247_13590 [Acidihalobacter ferrooxydans]